MQIYTDPNSKAIWRCPLSSSHRNQGSRWMDKIFSGQYPWAGAWQMESTKIIPKADIPWEQLHITRWLDVCQTCSLPLRPKLKDKRKRAHSHKGWWVCPLSVPCPGGGSLSRMVCPFATGSIYLKFSNASWIHIKYYRILMLKAELFFRF